MTTRSPRLRFLQAVDSVSRWLPRQHLPLPRNEAGVALSPFLQGLLQLRRLATALQGGFTSAQEMRQRFRQEMLALQVGFPVQQVEEISIPGPAGPLQARLYRPASTEALPVLLLYFHGGGFIMGDLDTHDDACRLLCQHSGMSLLAVDYRLAPEYPFPAAVEDAQAAAQWALENAARLGLQAVAVGGDSAGGNLAAVIAQTLSANSNKLLAQLLIYPGTDRSTARPSHARFGEGFFLTREDRELFYQSYLSDALTQATDPRVSPLLGQCPPDTAPALIVTAGFDMLRDEGTAYAAFLRQAGIPTEQLHFDALGHGFINLAGIHQESRQALADIASHWRLLCQHHLNRGEKS